MMDKNLSNISIDNDGVLRFGKIDDAISKISRDVAMENIQASLSVFDCLIPGKLFEKNVGG